ncbi:MAG: dicarboxylate/amino acid:cation symporter, partial [Candidatus Moduliflexus flocculans]|nr:dicarboxylate/amino acid:cation symporter [Candidatus Moduliflexus flocculans]
MVFKKDAAVFKPLGDIFLNLLFTVIVPLVFFSISSTVASMTNFKRPGRNSLRDGSEVLSIPFVVVCLTLAMRN